MTPTVREAIRLVHSVDPNAPLCIPERSKSPDMVNPRQMIWAVLQLHGWSLPEIGRRTGGYDHSSILYGIRRAYAKHGGALIRKLAEDMPKRTPPKQWPEHLSERVKPSRDLRLPANPERALEDTKQRHAEIKGGVPK